MASGGGAALPTSGDLTFLFTDIEGSTRRASQLGDEWFPVLDAHHAVLRPVFIAHGGVEVSTAGDSFFVVFSDAAKAVAATVAMQRAIAAHDWAPQAPIRVRMGLHTGPARFHADDYAGLTVHAASRVESAAAGGQVLITDATRDAAEAVGWPEGVDLLDLGEHRLKDLPAPLRLHQIVADGLGRDFPPVRGIDTVRNNVPVPPSSFVGRTEVLSRLHRILDDDRLLTLLGPGGTGKTRVALQLAGERLHRYPDGVWFVELDPARDEAGVVAAVAGALDVREERGRPLADSVTDHLRHATTLLVIDNCEHVIDAAARVVDRIVRAGQGVRVVATSREALEVGGERVWPLAPLAVNDDDPANSEAVRLLVDRVERVRPDFELNGNTPAAAAIVRRLDGLPLAIELAAASAAELELEEIAERLDNRFEVLTRGSRTALDRQKTLWGAIDWSWSLLNDTQRTLFQRLGVFPGEFDFGVVDNVCGTSDNTTADTLRELIRKSLVTETPSTRFRLLESVRAYAREQLTAAGEFDAVSERHARWFVDSVDKDSRPEWLAAVADDVLAALDWGGRHDSDVQLRALVQLQGLWLRTGQYTVGRELSGEVLAATAALTTRARAEALGEAGRLAIEQGDLAASRAFFEQSVAMWERVSGPETAAVVRGNLGAIALREGDLDTAETLYSAALAVARHGAGNARNEGVALCALAQIAFSRDDLATAWSYGNDAIEAARTAEDDEVELLMANLLGMVAQRRGDRESARTIYEDALSTARKAELLGVTPYLLLCLASVELEDANPDAAAARLSDALTVGHNLGSEADVAEALEASARVASARGQTSIACHVLAAADAVRDRIGFSRPPVEIEAYDATVEDIRGGCSADDFDAGWSHGTALTTDEAVELALEFLRAV